MFKKWCNHNKFNNATNLSHVLMDGGVLSVPFDKLNEFYEKFGWKDDAIFIIGDISRNNRIIKSLEFLATSSGAQLQKSSF